MSNLCDENDKIYKKKKIPDNKNLTFRRITGAASAILIAKGVRKMIDRI